MWAVAIALAAVAAGGCGRFGFGGDDPPKADARGGGIDGDLVPKDGDLDGMPTYACTGSEVCEGFENGVGVWMLDPMASIDTTFAHRGTKSMHVHSPAFAANTGSYQAIFQSQTVTANINPFWVRAWLYLSARPAFDNAMELITAERPGSAGDYVFVHDDRTNVYSQYDLSIMNTFTLVPEAQWFCLVWKVTRDTGNAGALELSGEVDVALTGHQTDSSTNTMQYVTIGIGYSSTNVPVAQPTQDLWIDDVIVSGTAVGCAD